MIIDEAVYLEHFGVKGQKWGVRRAEIRTAKGPDRFGNRANVRFQGQQNQLKRIASGRGSKTERTVAALAQIPLANIIVERSISGGAMRTLEQNQRFKDRVNAGRLVIPDMLNRLGGVDVREIDFDT